VTPVAPGVLVNDTDIDTPGPLTAVLDTGPAQAASFTLNADGSFTYTHNGSETVTDSFTYRASDGALLSNIATVTITITPVDDAPVATNDSYTVAELGSLTPPAPGVLVNDQDPENDALTAILVTGPTHALTFTLNADGSFTYTNNGDEAATDIFTYRAQAAGVDSNIATVTIAITNVNDPPLALPDTGTIDEDTVLNVPAAGVLANDTDPDLGDTKAVVIANGGPVGFPSTTAKGATLIVNANGSYSYNPTGVAAFQALGVGQSDTDTFAYTMQDSGGLMSSSIVTITVHGVNDGPVLDLDANDSSGATGANYQLSFTEGDPATFIEDATDATITDVDSPTLSSITVTLTNLLDPTFELLDVDLTGFANFSKAYDTTTDPTKGVLSITTAAPQPIADFITVLRRVTYRNTDNAPDTTNRVIEFVVNDGAGNGNTATTTVTVVGVDSGPTADNDSYSVNEGATLTITAPGVLGNDSDADSPGATLTAALVTGPANAASFTLNSDGSFSYQHNGSETTTDSFTYTATSSTGGTSAPATVTITINAVNDAPAITAGATITFTEGEVAKAIDTTILVSDPDDTNLESATVQITANYANGQDILAMPVTPGIGSAFNALTGTLTLTGSATVAAYQAALRTVTYFNGSNNPSQAARTVAWTVNDGTANSNTATSTINVVAVNDPPIVVPETFDLLGNTELRVDMVAGTTPHTSETTTNPNTVEGVLDNDGDPEGDLFAVTAVTGCTDPDATFPLDCTLAGGAVLHIAANGEFSYTPAPGATSGSFTYTVTDTPVQGLPASTNGTVTFTFFDMIWYVDADAPAGGNGTSRLPFNTFTATTLSGGSGIGDLDDADDYIFLHGAAAAITTGIGLEASQHLIGEAAGLVINRVLNGNPAPVILVPADAAQRPLISVPTAGSAVAINGAVANEVTGLALGSTINAIDLTTATPLSGAATLNIANNVINSAGAEGIDVNLLVGTTGALTLAITGNTWNTANAHAGNAVDINRAAGTLNLNFSNNTFIKSNAAAVLINGGAVGNMNITGFANNSVHQSTLGSGVSISNVTFDADTAAGGFQQVNGGTLAIGVSGDPVGAAGMTLTTVQGNLSFSDLDVFAGSSGLTATGTGGGLTFAVTPQSSGGTSTINAANGAGVDFSTATLDLRLSSLTVTTSTAGVSLNALAAGSQFSAPTGSSITKSSGAGTAFSVSGSNVAVAYAGSLNVTAGAGVSLTGNNAAATFTFNGGMTLSTGANAGFVATGGGTVNVVDPAGAANNTISTTTGTALNVANTTIGSSGLVFQSISANGAANGIIVQDTGATAGLTVSGTGGAASGGIIQNITNRGASFINAVNVSLTDMNFINANTTDGGNSDGVVGSNTDENAAIHLQNVTQVDLTDLLIDGTVQHGINANNVTDLDISNTTIQNTGDEVWESNLYLWDIKGVASAGRTSVLNNLTLTNDSGQFNIWIQNNDGTNDRPGEKDRIEITNSTFTRNGNNALISDNVSAFNSGTGNTQVVVTASTFASTVTCGAPLFIGACVSDNIQVSADNSAAFDFDLSSGNTFTNGNAGQAAVNISATGAGQGTFNVRNVSTSVRASTGINVALTTTNSTASLRGTIANNSLSTSVTNNAAAAINMVLEGAGTMVVDVNNNTINGTETNDFDYGIRGGARAGSGTAHFQVNNNNVPSAEAAGVWFFAGNNTGGETSQTCVNFVSNNVDGNSLSFADYFVEMYTGTTFQIQGLSGAAGPFIAATDDDPSPTDPTVDYLSGTASNYTNGVCSTPLIAADGRAPATVSAAPLTASQAAPVLRAALARWRAQGLTPSDDRALEHVTLAVMELPEAYLGEARGSTITLDATAAGWGWFVDSQSGTTETVSTERLAGDAAARIDLLTVLLHEIGHVLGRSHVDPADHSEDMMAGTLPRGVRRVP
jgi:large repetitive protein